MSSFLPCSISIGLADAPAAPSAAPAVAAAPPAGGAPATGAGTQQAPNLGPMGCGGGLTGFMPFVLIFAVFYFLLIRPQQKKQKEQQEWLKQIKKGDEVVTSGGLIGKVSGLNGEIVTLELQEKVRVRVLRSSIAGKPPAPAAAGSSSSPSTDAPK